MNNQALASMSISSLILPNHWPLFCSDMNEESIATNLAPEILTSIFQFCDVETRLTAITQVCQWWRQVAMSASPLWSNIDLNSILDTAYSPLGVQGTTAQFPHCDSDPPPPIDVNRALAAM